MSIYVISVFNGSTSFPKWIPILVTTGKKVSAISALRERCSQYRISSKRDDAWQAFKEIGNLFEGIRVGGDGVSDLAYGHIKTDELCSLERFDLSELGLTTKG